MREGGSEWWCLELTGQPAYQSVCFKFKEKLGFNEKKKVESSQTLGQTPNFNLYICVHTQALIPAHISAHIHTNKYIYHALDTTHIDKMFQKKRHCFAKRLNSL